MAKTTPFVAVRIDKDVYDVVAEVAKEMNLSTTWLINDILRRSAEAAEVAKSNDE